MDHRSVYRATAVMTAGTALSRITGLARVAAMAYALGVAGTRLADTYNLSNTTPNIIYELFLGGVFTAVFLPVLIALRADPDSDDSALVTVSLLALAVVSALAAALAPLVIKVYAFRIADPGIRRAQEELGTYLLRWFSPQIFFYGLSAVAQALLNARRRFAAPMFAPVLNNLIVIATFVAFARMFGERGLHLTTGAKVLLGAGTTAGVVVQALVLVPLLRAERLRFAPRLRDPGVLQVLRLSVWVIGYVVLNQLGLWVTYALANRTQGAVTAYQVAFMFFQLPNGLFAVSLITALFPDLSTAAVAGDEDAYRGSLGTGIRGVAYLLLPAVAGYLILAKPIARLVLARGLASAGDAALVAAVLQAFALGLVFFSAFQLFTRAFAARRDTRTPLLVNTIVTVVWIGANVPLFAALGVRGLALGHAVSYVVGAVLLGAALGRRIGGIGLRAMAAPLAKITVAAAGTALGVWGVARAIPGPDVATVGACLGTGTILYLAFSRFLAIPERHILVAAVRRRERTRSAG